MAKAEWNGVLLAQSNRYEVVEGNIYFPAVSVNMEYVRQSDTHTECGRKGTASYYDVEVDGLVNRDAAWFYPEPKQAAANIKDHVAFWRGVQISE